MVDVEQVEEQDLAVADPALLSRLRRIDEALTDLCQQHAAQNQRLLRIEGAIERLCAAVARRDALLAVWIDPAIDLTGLMAQLAEIGRMNAHIVRDLAAQLAHEHAATRAAIDLAVGAAGLVEAEIG